MEEVIGKKSILEPLLFVLLGSIFTVIGAICVVFFVQTNGVIIPVLAMLSVGLLFALVVTLYGFKLLKRPKNLIIVTGTTLFLAEENKEILLSDISRSEVYYRKPVTKRSINGIMIHTKTGYSVHVPQLKDPLAVAKTINDKVSKVG